MPPQQLFDELRPDVADLIGQQYELLNQVMFPELAKADIRLCPSERLEPTMQQEWLSEYFYEQVVPVLTPLTFDPSRPFPRILNKSLNFICVCTARTHSVAAAIAACLQAPRSLPRIIRLPDELSQTRRAQLMYFCRRSFACMSIDSFPGWR